MELYNRELITCVYRIDVRASLYKIYPPLLITCTDCRLQSTDCTDKQDFFTFLNKKKLHKKNSRKILTVFQKTV